VLKRTDQNKQDKHDYYLNTIAFRHLLRLTGTLHPGLGCLEGVVLTHAQIQTQARPHFKNSQHSLAERTTNRTGLRLCRITP